MINDEWIKEKTEKIVSENRAKYANMVSGNFEGIILTSIISALVYVIAKEIFEECIQKKRRLAISDIVNPSFFKRMRLNRMIKDKMIIASHENMYENCILDTQEGRDFIGRNDNNFNHVNSETFKALINMGTMVKPEDLP